MSEPPRDGFFHAASPCAERQGGESVVDNVWLVSALWLGLTLTASVISIWVGISVALIEIMVGTVAGNTICKGMELIGQVSDLGVGLRTSDGCDQQATATGWLC